MENQESLAEIFSFLGDKIEALPEEEPKYTIICRSVWRWYIDPATGTDKSYILKCGDFRNCDTCHYERREMFQLRILMALEEKRIGIMTLDDRAAQIIKAVTKDDYLRLPSDNGGALFYNIDACEPEFTDYVQIETALGIPAEFDWDDLTNTSEGSRPSGNLGKRKDHTAERKASGEWTEITTDTLEISAQDEGKAKIAFVNAIAETCDLNPQTPEEVETAVSQRTDVIVRLLEEKGVKIRSRGTRKFLIRNTGINWKKFSHMYVTNHTTHDSNKDNKTEKPIERPPDLAI